MRTLFGSSFFRRYTGRIWRWGRVHAAVFGSLALIFWFFHPHAPQIVRRIAEKPAFLLDIRQEKSCEGCHRRLDPGLYLQWWESVHARANVGCADCHGEDHSAVFTAKGKVPASVCGRCHAKETEAFARSGHGTAEADAVANARFLMQSEAMQIEGCMACHEIGAQWEDGSVGACNKCHPDHAFSAAFAREPEACEVCHIGPDHPQVEAYRSSVHGVLYLAERDARKAPSCVTCHMPEGMHGGVENLTLGQVATGAVAEDWFGENIAMRRISREAMVENRKRMLEICAPCHTMRFARESLARADAIKQEADALVAQARAIIVGLYNDGLIHPMPLERRANPVVGHTLELGGQQLYENVSEVEQAFFRMFKFYHAKTFKGAYHHSPDYTHWMGNAFLKMELSEIQARARLLRQVEGVQIQNKTQMVLQQPEGEGKRKGVQGIDKIE